MATWMTVAEIAQAKLPGLPETKRGVQMLAQSEGWDTHPAFVRPRAGRGGGLEYDIRILPTLARLELLKAELTIGAELPAAIEAEATPSAALSDRAARERDARLAIVAAFESFARGLPRLRHMSHLQVFQDKYNARTLHIEPWVLELVPRVSKRSIDRWRAARKEGATTALAVDRGQARKGTGVLDRANEGKVRATILALLAQNPLYSAGHIRDQVESLFGPALWVPYRGSLPGATKSVPLPPVRTFQSFIATLRAENQVVLTKLTDPDKYRSTMLPAGVGSLRHIERPNMLWQIDASPVDALCTDGRHSVYGCIDICSRRAVVLISRTPRAAAVALLLRKAILAWGVPETIKTDNGSDFVARDTQRLLLSLGIEQDVSDAYSPQQKGHIERFIRTFQHDFSRMLPGFVGHSVEHRKAIENRKSFAARLGKSEAETFDVRLTGLELQRFADKWVVSKYEQSPHHGLQGLSPAQKWNTTGFQPRRVDERAVDLLLMPVAGGSGDGIRTTTKFGIRVSNYHYATPTILPAQRVLVRQDPEDMGRVLAFEPDGGRFLGEGTCPELAGIHPATFMKAVRQLHSEALDAVAKPIRKLSRELAKGPLPIERALALAEERDQTNVVSLPEVAQVQHTRQIEAALAAMDEVPRQTKAEANALFQTQLVAETQAPSNVQPLRTEETEHQRYRRALRIEQMLAAGEAVEERELGWLQGYQTGSEYRTMKTMHADFGDQVLG